VRAHLAANAFAFIGLSFLLALAAILAGHAAAWRIRRRSSLIGAGWARAAWILGYGTLIFLFFIVRIPATDWPPLISTSEDRAIYVLESVDWSLREFANAVKGRGFPESLDELKSVEALRKSAEWHEGMLKSLAASYQFAYRAGPKDSQVFSTTYSAEMTPLTPGEIARASFFIDETGILRWTPEPRAATPADPPWRQTVEAARKPSEKQAAEKKGNETVRDAVQLGRVRAIVSCALAYSILHPERGLPRNEEELGPAGARCFSSAGFQNQGDYRLAYLPGAPDAQGRVNAFRVESSPVAYNTTGTISYLADESGKVRTTRENRPATSSDSIAYAPPRALREEIVAGFESQAVQWLHGLNDCISSYAQMRADGALPAALPDLRPPNSECGSQEIVQPEIGKRWGYTVVYRSGAKDARGRIQSYTISARPLRFGETGKKSFYTDETGVVRGTSENRAAAARDPSTEPNFDPEANERAALGSIRQIWKCVGNFSVRQNAGAFPADLRQMGPGGLNCIAAQLASGQEHGYVFMFSSRRPPQSDVGMSFSLGVTPVSHGKTGIRSFLLDESGLLRATKIHRLPRADDPVVESLKK
jgi:hypothetical protein